MMDPKSMMASDAIVYSCQIGHQRLERSLDD